MGVGETDHDFFSFPLGTLRAAELYGGLLNLVPSALEAGDAAEGHSSEATDDDPRAQSKMYPPQDNLRGLSSASSGGAKGEGVQDLVINDLSRISLPEGGQVLVDLADVAPPEVVERVSDPARLARVVAPGAPRNGKRGVLMILPHLLVPFLHLLFLAGMIAFHPVSFAATDACGNPIRNGVFWVPKRDKRRLIIDERPGNAWTVDPPDPNLPTPTDLGRILRYLRSQGEDVRSYALWKDDVKDYYHRIRVPVALQKYQCLHPLTASQRAQLAALGVPLPDGDVIPAFMSLCMGNKWAVYLGQSIMQHAIRRTLQRLPVPVQRSVFPFGYIDDMSVIAKVRRHCGQVVNEGPGTEFASAFRQIMVEMGFKLSMEKQRNAETKEEMLGHEVDFPRGRLGLSAAKLARIQAALVQVSESSGPISPRRVTELLGDLAWAFLACRPLFSFMFFVFKWLNAIPDKQRYNRTFTTAAPACVRRELRDLAAVLPLAFTSFSSPVIGTVISDACESGGAFGWSSEKVAFRSVADLEKI
jgi:hypothetical protein